MSRNLIRLAGACAVFAAVSAHAQWAREPDAVLGVRLGQPLAVQTLPPCPAKAYESPVTCLTTQASPLPGYPPMRSIGGHPFGYVSMSLKVDDSGMVNEIQAGMDQARFAEFKTVLIERYGQPTSTQHTTVQNGLGATFDAQILQWIGSRMSIIAMERPAQVNQSVVTFSDNAYLLQRTGAAQGRVKSDASKL